MIEVSRRFPENIIKDHLTYFQPFLKICLPEPGYKLYNGQILLFSNGILVNKFSVEKQSLLYDTRLKELGGKRFILREIIVSLLKNRISIINHKENYVTIVNEWTDNYFHWFTEAIPKLIYWLHHNKKPIVLLPAHYNAEYQLRSLELLRFSYKRLHTYLSITKNIFLPYRLAPYSAHYNPVVMSDISSKLKSKVNLGFTKGKRIYISRTRAGRRKVINEYDVINLIKEFDFSILEFEDYSLDEQISLMHNSDIIVSIHGAALTNILFCNPGTKIFELSLKNQVMDKCYYNLANAMNLKYFYQFCDSNTGSEDYQNADLLVDLAELKKNLLLITGNSKIAC